MLKYKIDVLDSLKSVGYSCYRIRKERIFSESSMTKFRNNIIVSSENIDRLCAVLNCQPGDIIEFVPDEK